MMLADLLREVFIVEYAAMDSIGRNKGWHNYGVIMSIDDLTAIKSEIKTIIGNRDFEVKVWKHSTAFGSVQIA